MGLIGDNEQRVLRLLWEQGALGRSQVAELTGMRPNDAGRLAATLIDAGLVREGSPAATTPGRPRVPLQIDPLSRRVLGLAITPGRVSAIALNLCGQPVGRVTRRNVSEPGRMIRAAAELLREHLSPELIGVGVSVTGFIDADKHRLLLSSAVPGASSVDLAALYDAAGSLPLVIHNDMHALAAQWLLTRRVTAEQDAILVKVDDGSLGAALIVNGRPNRGSIASGNELGHMRLPVPTDKCYCGHSGCLERIFSSATLAQLDRSSDADLAARAAAYDGSDLHLTALFDHLGTGIANVVNFIRPGRLVLISPLVRHAEVMDQLIRRIRAGALDVLATRLRIDSWDHSDSDDAETAGWLALADLYYEGWSYTSGVAESNHTARRRAS